MSDQGPDRGYGYGGTGGDPQYPADPFAGDPGHGASTPLIAPHQRGIFLGLGVVALSGLVVLVLALTGVFSSSGGPTDSPKQVVEKVLFASKKQNLDDVKAVVCRRDLTDPQLSDIVGDDHAVSYSIGDTTEQSDDRVLVDIRVTTTDDTQSSQLPVVKEDGQWKVCFSDETNPTGTAGAPSDSSTLAPPTLPSIPNLPSIDPSSSAIGLCGTQATASDVAKTFISFISIGTETLARDCVYNNRLSTAQLEALAGDIYSPDQNEGKPGPQFVFRSSDGKSTITLTVEKESDGKYYVTAASKR